MKEAFIAVDFGGGSGRVMAGVVSGQTLTLHEVRRFENRQVKLGAHTHWNFLSLFDEMVRGLADAVAAGYKIRSIGIDTWGVDFGFIDSKGNLLGNPICYRDEAVAGAADELFAQGITAAEHYSEAGIQIMDINSVFRLAKTMRTEPDIINAASRILFTPDLFSYFLTGSASNEYTIASTSGLLDARTRNWNMELIRKAGLPEHIFGEIVMPGTVRGKLTEDIKARIGVDYDVEVVAVGSHDTASAVHCVGGDFATSRTAYLSSGTWSLLGATIDEPILTEEARQAGFTNEGAVGGKIRFLQNITGLWILQSLMGQWKEQGLSVEYGPMLAAAESAEIDSVIDVDDQMFHSPRSMSEAIANYCREHSMQEPKGQGEYVRVVLQSLAARYKKGIDGLNTLLSQPVERLQIIGGGSRNGLLNRLTSEATGLEVVAGPVEATAIGNILVQAQSAGVISSPEEITEIK